MSWLPKRDKLDPVQASAIDFAVSQEGNFYIKGEAGTGEMGGPCYDWATEMRDKGVCVMGGFQSPFERDVLTFLLKGKQPVIWVLAHKLWAEKNIPKPYREPIAAGRLLVVSPVAQTATRVNARTAAIRNRYILEHSERVVFAAIDLNGALSRLIGECPDLQSRVNG